jgi:acetyl esterase/lipase
MLAAAMASSVAACSPAGVLNAIVPKGGVEVTRDVAYGDLPRQRLDIYRPRSDRPTGHAAEGLPVVIFFYGGSWTGGRKGIYPFVAATMARAGAVVVVPDYRLYPAVKYPDFLRDCARAAAWVQDHPAQTSPGPLFLMGHSAGAYNAMMLGLDGEWLRAAGGDPARVAGVIGLAGPYDFLPITDPEIVPVFPGAGPDSQPITYARADAPPLLLLTGTDDHQVKPRNTQALADRMRAVGGRVQVITYAGLGHIGLITALAPAFWWRAPVLRDVMAFVREQGR